MTSRKIFEPRVTYLPEPQLEFRCGQRLVYPRDGLFLYGPVGDTDQLRSIRYGVIGTQDGVRRFRDWSAKLKGFIDIPLPGPRSRAVEPQHVPFPGFAEAFHADWPIEPAAEVADLDPAAIDHALRLANRHEAVRSTVDLFVTQLVSENNRLENPPAVWFVIIPEAVYELGRPQSSVKKSERVEGSVTISKGRARQLQVQPTLFGDDEREAEVYKYANAFPASAQSPTAQGEDCHPDCA